MLLLSLEFVQVCCHQFFNQSSILSIILLQVLFFFLFLDRDGQKDAQRNLPENWKKELDDVNQCKHYFYRGEAIFYGIQMVFF